jgi:hypothetical protein
MSLPSRRLHSIALDLAPAQYLALWRPAEGVLFLPALGEGRVGDEVAARLGLEGRAIRATVFGPVCKVRRVGRPSLPPGVELALDRASLPAARFLATAARGEEVSFRERAPRYLLQRLVRVRWSHGESEVATQNVSEGGCAVAWPTAGAPAPGEVVTVLLAPGLFAPQGRAVVCWTAPQPPLGPALGLRLVAEGRAARGWARLIAGAARAGGRVA